MFGFVCLLASGSAALAASSNGVAGAMPAYYDGQLFLINFKELPPAAEQSVLAGNQSVNTIFTSEARLPGDTPFVAVLDAIQGDGFNPLWLEVEIEFRPGVTPYQITRDDVVTAARERGDIDLSSAGEIYRCAVIGAGAGGRAAGATAGAAAGAVAGVAGSTNGSAGDMPAFYDGRLFTINFKKQPDGATGALLAHNGSINTIFMSDPGLPGGQPFIAVLDAIQGDGFNPLWLEIQITFNAGFTPRQLLRDDDVFAAQASGEITLSSQGEVYRCAVVGAKN
ncbi:MAG: hypothetical protein AUI47_10150 [Acidobacteria bacterium 13_1_40CM_2_68_5]|nr:MAG: hypothetical protein AUI47_10150 [Acidobacteria bacterium 13_1_40CM_2_68_5]